MCSARASCHKHHTPTQSLTHPASFHPPPPLTCQQSHTQSSQIRKAQATASARRGRRLKANPHVKQQFSYEFPRKSGQTVEQLVEHSLHTGAPLGHALAEALFLRETELRSPPERSLRALSSARLLSLSSLKTFKYFFFCIEI